MGEWSKSVGERGEKIVADLLNLVGWGEAQAGIDIPCSYPTRHRQENSDRRSHGIDYSYCYVSRTADSVLDNLVISAKFTAEPYPASPSLKFRSHFKDLARAMECFKKWFYRL
jgi:hypothetical protein